MVPQNYLNHKITNFNPAVINDEFFVIFDEGSTILAYRVENGRRYLYYASDDIAVLENALSSVDGEYCIEVISKNSFDIYLHRILSRTFSFFGTYSRLSKTLKPSKRALKCEVFNKDHKIEIALFDEVYRLLLQNFNVYSDHIASSDDMYGALTSGNLQIALIRNENLELCTFAIFYIDKNFSYLNFLYNSKFSSLFLVQILNFYYSFCFENGAKNVFLFIDIVKNPRLLDYHLKDGYKYNFKFVNVYLKQS